jgi:hypothetical protein
MQGSRKVTALRHTRPGCRPEEGVFETEAVQLGQAARE